MIMNKMMPVIMNDQFERLAVVDDYSSFIWSTRYYTSGDFQLIVDVNETNMHLFMKNYYVVRDDDENVGIIEDITIERNEDAHEVLIVKGRFLDAIIGRRIIAQQTTVTGKISDCIEQLINDNIINPSVEARKIANFTIDSNVININMQAQYTGKNLLDTISSLCKTYGIGYKVTLNDDHEFVFQLYEGTDRTYDQNVNPWVIFSDTYDNLLSSQYEENYKNIATAVLVAGEGEGLDRKTAWVSSEYDPIGNNIVSSDDVSASNLSDYNYADGVYSGTSSERYGGLKITTDDLMTVGNVYVIKYKLQKTAGELVNIGGHNAAFTQYSFTVDGNDAGSYQNGYTLPDDTTIHEIMYVGKFNGTGTTDLNFYIQPNRGSTTSISFKITDLEIYVSQGITGLARYEVYKDQRNIRSNDGSITEEEYIDLLQESGKESLTKYTTAFTGTVYFDNITYKQDINVGDLCVIENARWGIYLNTRLVEVIESVSETGDYTITPTFGV